jgi:hypothetical protein
MNWIQIIVQSIIISVIVVFFTEWLKIIFQKKLESWKNELIIIQTSFSQNYSFILSYYTNFYKHYRRCCNVLNYDYKVYPDNTTKNSRETFLEQLNTYVKNVNEIEPTIRLIFPEHLMAVHDNSISVFNSFRSIIKSDIIQMGKPDQELISSFEQIQNVKNELEKGLRDYLRTERIIRK